MDPSAPDKAKSDGSCCTMLSGGVERRKRPFYCEAFLELHAFNMKWALNDVRATS